MRMPGSMGDSMTSTPEVAARSKSPDHWSLHAAGSRRVRWRGGGRRSRRASREHLPRGPGSGRHPRPTRPTSGSTFLTYSRTSQTRGGTLVVGACGPDQLDALGRRQRPHRRPGSQPRVALRVRARCDGRTSQDRATADQFAEGFGEPDRLLRMLAGEPAAV